MFDAMHSIHPRTHHHVRRTRVAREPLIGYATAPATPPRPKTARDGVSSIAPHPAQPHEALAPTIAPHPAQAHEALVPPVPPHPAQDPVTEASACGVTEPPFGLPVLAEVPELARLLEDLRQVDRMLARAIVTIQLLEDNAAAEITTGISLADWIGLIARRTATDTRMLTTAARVLRRVPTLAAAFTAGQVSWAQTRAVVLMIRPLPGHLDDRIDHAVAACLSTAGIHGEPTDHSDPDDLTRRIDWELARVDDTPTRDAETDATNHEFLAMQPRLDGTGGRLHGELGPISWAIIDAALNTPTPRKDTGQDPGEIDAGHQRTRTPGERRLERLVALCDRALTPGPRAGSSKASARSRPQLLLRAELSALLDDNTTPAQLLTTLTGGRVRVTASTARQLIEHRGADLRTIILDDIGTIVGVGRRTRIPPGWVTDAALVRHTTCSAPRCTTAARRCDLDHARPWYPTRPHQPPGRTDLANLAPTCTHHNRRKEPDGWQVEQRPDGTRRWHHPRSGLTTTTRPDP